MSNNFKFPIISMPFSKDLLYTPEPKFYHDSRTLLLIFKYIEKKLKKKCNHHYSTMKKYIEFEEKFKELYERIKEKEIEYEKKNGKSFQEPFDYFYYTGRNYRKVYGKIILRSSFE